jgi:hypothetical protein
MEFPESDTKLLWLCRSDRRGKPWEVAGRLAAGFLPVVAEGLLVATAARDEGTEENREERLD